MTQSTTPSQKAEPQSPELSFPDGLLSYLIQLGYDYPHGISPVSPIFFNKERGAFFSYKEIKLILAITEAETLSELAIIGRQRKHLLFLCIDRIDLYQSQEVKTIIRSRIDELETMVTHRYLRTEIKEIATSLLQAFKTLHQHNN